jgi:hypothetical protein
MSCPFGVLGLPPTATDHEVRSAFRRLALVHHPDHGGDAAAFAKLRWAYGECLLTARPDGAPAVVSSVPPLAAAMKADAGPAPTVAANGYRATIGGLDEVARQRIAPVRRRVRPTGLSFDETLAVSLTTRPD